MQAHFMLREQFTGPSFKAMRTVVIRRLQGYGNTASLSYPDTWVRKPDRLHLPSTCFLPILFLAFFLPGFWPSLLSHVGTSTTPLAIRQICWFFWTLTLPSSSASGRIFHFKFFQPKLQYQIIGIWTPFEVLFACLVYLWDSPVSF